MDKISNKTINRLICFSLLVFSISIMFVVSKYVGLINLLYRIIKSLIPVFIAVFFSFILEPLIGFFLKKGIKRKYSVFLVYGVLLILFVILLYFTIPPLVEQINVLIENIPGFIEIIMNFFNKLGLNIDETKFVGSINDILINLSKKIMRYLGSSFSIIFNVLLGISGAIFLSFDFPKFRNGIKEYIPKRIKSPIIYYFQKFLPFVHKYFMGMLIDSILIFVISVIGFSIIEIEYTLVISLFIALTNLIPIIGPYIGGIPATIIGFSMSPTLGVSAVVVVVIVQIIESNFVQPLILKNVIELHPLEGILGISLFGALFGVVGMILSPILIVAIKLLFLPYDDKENIV